MNRNHFDVRPSISRSLAIVQGNHVENSHRQSRNKLMQGVRIWVQYFFLFFFNFSMARRSKVQYSSYKLVMLYVQHLPAMTDCTWRCKQGLQCQLVSGSLLRLSDAAGRNYYRKIADKPRQGNRLGGGGDSGYWKLMRLENKLIFN